MNSKFLIFTSLLIALLCHLVLFNLVTFVFRIDPASHKPKFFFLGPILSQNDVRRNSSFDHALVLETNLRKLSPHENNLKSKGSNILDQTKTPFAIRTIKKPLSSQAIESQNKITLKSTFETHSENELSEEPKVREHIEPELKIQTYRPLRFRSP